MDSRWNWPPGLRATFLDAGHILGSASVLLELQEQGNRRRVLFSGDLGNAGRPLLRAPVPVPADVVVMETTYGDRSHKSLASSVGELFQAVTETFQQRRERRYPDFCVGTRAGAAVFSAGRDRTRPIVHVAEGVS